jgi:hypothetical protein
MTETKGAAIKFIPQFIREKFGEKAFQKWFNSIPPESQKIYSSTILVGNWYPLKYASAIPMNKLIELFYNNEPKGGIEIGEYTAEKLLTGIHKLFIKIGSPKFIISKASSWSSMLFRPIESKIIELDSKFCKFRITKLPEVTEALEYSVIGAAKRAGELSGAKNGEILITSSIAKGDPYTEYISSWE